MHFILRRSTKLRVAVNQNFQNFVLRSCQSSRERSRSLSRAFIRQERPDRQTSRKSTTAIRSEGYHFLRNQQARASLLTHFRRAGHPLGAGRQ
ncbi:hypothetical protein COCOBI_12-2380 [Coccomyxa sp. Obi]|nr:hypothetical protein COCOBI_12-2380 [Coccomyxa sp. Obi]